MMLLIAGSSGVRAGVPRLYAVMDHEPSLPTQRVERHVPVRWRQLWREALAGPEEDLRREAALAILREQQRGTPNLDEFAISLRGALSATRQQAVRLTIATALIELDDREAAPGLFELVANGGANESLIIEPALARWDYKPMRDVWLARLSDPEGTPHRLLLLAVDGVRAVHEYGALGQLRKLAVDSSTPAEVRLAAARALGELKSEGLDGDARRLAANASPRAWFDRMIAAHLLITHRGNGPEQLLLQLAGDEQPAVAAVALRRLLEIDPALVQPHVGALLGNRDAAVRQLAARSLVERPSLEVFPTLGELLDDPHADVRSYVRDSMLDLARRPEFDEIVRRRAMDVLDSVNWRGLEQAARIVGELDHEPAAPRLVELLDFDRAEVRVTAAWSLSRLGVRETLPGMLAFADRLTLRYSARPLAPDDERRREGVDACLSHLFQAFGMMRYAESEPVLLQFVPRRYDLTPRSRGAAVWALGLLHENDPQPELMNLLGHRVADEGDLPYPEPVEVRANAAVSLGRMNAAPALEVLRLFYEKDPPGDRIREACGWAIEQITGEDLPDPETKLVAPRTPFLQPVDP